MKKKVMVAMSGGVDSSVAAYLLRQEGCEVTGVTMCLGTSEGTARCCGLDAVKDARRVCEKLHLPHFVFDFAGELEEKIIAKFVSEYLQGRTPNPCVDCNRYLKFGSLLAKAAALGFDYLATGHYACIEGQSPYFLKRPRDKAKDQTYFLYAMPDQALGKTLFPLALLTKTEVRAIARQNELPVAEKTESQDLCFVGRQDYPDFVSRRMLGTEPGPIVDSSGKRLGTHRGIVYYTIGQRSGLGIANPVPLYVVSIDAAANLLVVGKKEDLRAKGLIAADVHRLVADWPPVMDAKIRYRREAVRCRVDFADDKVKILFEEEQESVSPGQAVVFYDRDIVLGGATIEETIYGN